MSDEWVAFFDFKEHESGNLQFGGMIVSSETLESIEEITYFIPSDIDGFRKNSSTRWLKEQVTFPDISEEIYNMLIGRIWMGHDIIERDIPRLRAEFIKVSKEFPAPKTVIDTVLFTSSNTRLAKLSVFCGLGYQKRGSCKDCIINLNAIKECETIMLILKNKKRNSGNRFHPMLSFLMKSADATERFTELMRGEPVDDNEDDAVVSRRREFVVDDGEDKTVEGRLSSTDKVKRDGILDKVLAEAIPTELDRECHRNWIRKQRPTLLNK